MLRAFELISGTILFLVGILGFLFREGFGNIPAYLLVVNILLGAWGLYLGLLNSQPSRQPKPPADEQGYIEE